MSQVLSRFATRFTDAPMVAWDLRGSHSPNSPRGIASPVFRQCARRRRKSAARRCSALLHTSAASQRRHGPRARVRGQLPRELNPSGVDAVLRRRVSAAEPCRPKRDAASAQRQLEKCLVGVPGRGGAVSWLPFGSPVRRNDWALACGLPPAAAGIVSTRAGEAFFRASAEARRGDVASPESDPLTKNRSGPSAIPVS